MRMPMDLRLPYLNRGQVRPLALSPDGSTLFALNTPDHRVEVFRTTETGLQHCGAVQVGLEPVAVAVRSETEIWVVNHLSDSVSIVQIETTACASPMGHVIGLPDREPLKIGGNAAAYTTGMSAFSASMLALHVRDEHGHGQCVDVSAMETMTVGQIHASIQHQFGHEPKRRDSSLVRAWGGWVHPGLDRGIAEDTWARVCDLMGQPELAADPRFTTREARRENQAELSAIIVEWTATLPKEEIYHTLQGLRTVAGYVATVEDLRTSGQLTARDFFQTIDHPSTGEGVYPGALFTLQDTPWQHGRAPLLGEHNAEIYGERLGYSRGALEQLYRDGII